MGFIREPMDPGPELVPEGEYQLTVSTFKHVWSFTIVKLHVEGHAATITHWLSRPSDDLSPDERRSRLLEIKRFLVHFQVPHSGGFDDEDLLEATARCWVTQKKGKDGTIYNRVQLPRLKREET